MGYRPSSNDPSGPWGLGLDKWQREQKISRVVAFERLHEGLGYTAKSRASYYALLRGREPTPAQQKYLRSEGVVPIEGGATDEAPTLAGALSALADELRENRLERAALAARVGELEALVARLTERGFGAGRERGARQPSAG